MVGRPRNPARTRKVILWLQRWWGGERTANPSLFTRYPLALYWVLACGFSWLITVPLALSAQGIITPPLPYELHYLSAYGPLLAAIVVTALTAGVAGLRNLAF
jgi:hypothetical protein